MCSYEEVQYMYTTIISSHFQLQLTKYLIPISCLNLSCFYQYFEFIECMWQNYSLPRSEHIQYYYCHYQSWLPIFHHSNIQYQNRWFADVSCSTQEYRPLEVIWRRIRRVVKGNPKSSPVSALLPRVSLSDSYSPTRRSRGNFIQRMQDDISFTGNQFVQRPAPTTSGISMQPYLVLS